MTDEDGNVLYEFSNQLNQVIMTRQIDKSINHDTYYIYDNYGKLRIVLPPIASEKLSDINNYPETNPDINNYAYLYRYDARNRCIAKKIPGADWIYYIHDTADRIILSQNGEQRERGEWSFSIPDGLGRAVIEGICHNTIDYKQNPIKDIYVKATYNGNPQYAGYSISGFSPDAGYRITNVNYYDNYDFIPDLIPSPEKYGYDSVDGYDTRYTDYKDLLTGTATAILDERENTTYLYSVFYYDKKGRMIQSKSDNHLGGTEKEYTAYNFIDQPVTRKNIHVLNGNTITEEYGYFYDHADRLIKTTHKLNDNPVITISENTYDETGRLSTNTRGNNALLKSSYSYNIRSWITQISGNLFSQQLFYENPMPQGSAIYGGNISGISWTTNNITRNYRFSYDGLSRITKANYSGPGNFYSSYQYDKHGNITKLSRFGNTDSGNYSITDLVSFYYNGNQLKKADDAAIQIFNNLSADFKNYADADVEYSYNKNGALTKDLNKGITDIQYNLLNLPSEINISTPFTVGCTKYLYAANGMKLRVSHNNDPGLLNIPLMGTDQYYRSNLSDGSVTDFVGNLVYEDNTLKRILIDGGYIENSTYYFFLTDHLGSIRVVADASGSVVQRNHFYPFGLSFADNENPETQPYKFNGKELDLFHGLNWYDYLARGMDPAAGRFTAIDPLCEKYFALSPYVFCANNPVNYIDPDGKIIKIANNRVNALTYFAKIAATNLGSSRMNDLIRSKQTYTAKSVFLTKDLKYDNFSNTIYYVNDSWYSDIDGGSPSEYALLGHELDHAWHHHNFQIDSYKGMIKNRLYLEKEAVSFENYLRTAYGDNNIRRKYEGLKGGKEWEFFPYNLNRNNELITNFSQLGHNRNKTSLGFSYEKSVNNGKSVKQYLIISTDKNDNLNYRIFNSKEEYDKATFNW